MSIAVLCSCGRRLKAKSEFAGKRVKCPACGVTLTVPTHDSATDPAGDPARDPQMISEPKPRQLASVDPDLRTNTAEKPLLKKFLNEDQDPAAVEKAIEFITPLCTSDEEIQFVAVQKKPVPTLVTTSVVLTNKRLIVFHHKLIGSRFEDYLWIYVRNAHVKEGLLGATFTALTTNNRLLEVGYLPKAQAKRLYQFAQEMEERVLVLRRQRELEDKRAAAGGVFLGGPQFAAGQHGSGSPPDDPVARLQKLKLMLDQGLITAEEHENKKSKILENM